MKQFLFVAIAALALLSSCTKTPSVSVSVSISDNVLSALGGTVTADVTSDGEWRTSVNDTNVVIEPSSGSGSQKVSIKVAANNTSEEKRLLVTFSCVLGTSSQTDTIYQSALDVSVTPQDTTVSASGGTVKVNVTSAGEWRTSTVDGISVNPSSGSGDAVVTITVPANTSDMARDVEVKFYSALNSSVSDIVTIHQKSISFSVTPEEKDVAASGGTVEFAVTTDGEWKTFAENGAEVSPSSGSGSNNQVKVIVPANTATQPRDIKVTFYSTQNPSLSQTVIIHQKAPGISVEPIEGTVLAKGGDVTVDVTSDGGFTVPAGDDFTVNCSDWRESGTKSVKITVKPNATGKERDVKVTFRSKLEPSISETVTIHQESISISVTPSSQQSVSASGGTVNFTVTADGAWKASADVSGTTITPSEWSILGKKQADVTVPANTTGETREVTVKFWLKDNADIFQTVTISQDLISISVSPTKVDDVPASGSEVKVNLISNGEWETSIGDWTDSDGHKITADKVTLSTSSGSSWSGEVTVTVPANTTGQERRAKVTFRSKQKTSISQTVTIHQKAPSISVTPDEFNDAHAAGDAVGVTVTSDGDWTAGFIENSGTLTNYSGKSGESVTITIDPNYTAGKKDVKVKFYLTKHSTVSDIVIIHQKAPSISVSGLPDSVPAEGGEVNVKVTSDGGWGTRNLYSGATVSSSSHQGSGNDVPVTINVPKNTGEERDIKVIEFYSLLNANIKQAVTIHQKALEMSVTPQDATVSASGGTVDVNVTCDFEWKTYVNWYDSDGKTTISTSDIVTVSPSTGSGNKSVKITVPKNTSGKDRYIEVRFYNSKNASAKKIVTIHQKASK